MEPALINFESGKRYVGMNPRLSQSQAELCLQALPSGPKFDDHFFFLTSGTTAASDSSFKWVCLSRPAVFASAKAVNELLSAQEADIWANPLPLFHVGGVGIHARAYLSRSRVIDLSHQKWNPVEFANCCETEGATLSALSPTHVFDLVKAQLTAPPTLRAIVVGGGALEDSVYESGRSLGWPLLRSYGMTEAASQVATEPTARLESNTAIPQEMTVLDHLEAEATPSGRIMIRGGSLLSGYAYLNSHGDPEFLDPKSGAGWFVTSDLGKTENRILTFHGRKGDVVKVGGELVDMNRLRSVLAEIAGNLADEVALVAPADSRLGKVVAIVYQESADVKAIESIKVAFDRCVLPFERIRRELAIPRLPRTALGKIKLGALEEQFGEASSESAR